MSTYLASFCALNVLWRLSIVSPFTANLRVCTRSGVKPLWKATRCTFQARLAQGRRTPCKTRTPTTRCQSTWCTRSVDTACTPDARDESPWRKRTHRSWEAWLAAVRALPAAPRAGFECCRTRVRVCRTECCTRFWPLDALLGPTKSRT